MPVLYEQITVALPVEEAFTYTADFDNIEQWDPGVAASERIDDRVGVGTRFELVVTFGSRRLPMTYRITEYESPHKVVLVGEGKPLVATDTIQFEATDAGTLVTYTADLEFRGVMRLFVPFLGRRLRKVGEDAVAGLARELAKLVT